MHSHFDISTVQAAPAPQPTQPGELTAALLQQILDVQRQILAQLQASAAAQDASGRWRSLLAC